jgi:methionine synthase II (cobalamin-independent)
MTTAFTPSGLPVLIGSLPLADHRKALEMIFVASPEIPLWPQLPGNPLEQMMPQFAEGLPCICEENVTRPQGHIFFDCSSPNFEEQMLAFYEDYMSVLDQPDRLLTSRFQVSRERAEGLYQFVEALEDHNPVALKGQITGPFTMLTGIKDRQGRAGYYDDTVREMVIKGIALKAAWQTKFLTQYSKGKQVIVFIDEPALAGLGSSAFISVSTAAIQEMINEVAEAIQGAGGLAGIHVCANTQWDVLLNSRIDILSFDAYSFFDKLAAFSEQISSYLDRGSLLAWGGIPTGRAHDIEKESVQSLALLWEHQHKKLLRPDRDQAALLRQTLISPSCGTGSLQLGLAEKVLHLTKGVSETLRAKYL